MFNENKDFVDRTQFYLFKSAGENFVNIQMKAAWAIANYCKVMKSFIDEPETQKHYIAINVNNLLSVKEKTVANAVRAFGYIFESADIKKFEE